MISKCAVPDLADADVQVGVDEGLGVVGEELVLGGRLGRVHDPAGSGAVQHGLVERPLRGAPPGLEEERQIDVELSQGVAMRLEKC